MAKGGKKRKISETESVPEVSLSKEELAGLAEGLSKDQLVSLAKDAAVAHTDVRSKLQKLADQDPAARKLFVRGLDFSTDKNGVMKAFEEYGALEGVVVVMDKATGKNRGFGFVTFKHRDGALRALKKPDKKIDGRMTKCHLDARETETGAAASAVPPLVPVSAETLAFSRKVYIGHVPQNIRKSTLKTFFSQYGEIEEGPLGWDQKTGKCKGYAFIVYKSHESVRKCLLEPNKTVEGHMVQVRLADTKRKDKEEKAIAGPSTVGYDLTNPALIASHNPSFLQSGSQFFGGLPSELGSLHGTNALMPYTEAILGRASGSLSALYGHPLSNSFASSHPHLVALRDAHGLGISGLPRSVLL